MTSTDFIEKIRHGSDIVFDVTGKRYAIITWPDEGIAICEQNVTGEPRYFDSAESLVRDFKIDGVPLVDLCRKIIITEYTSDGQT